MRYPGGGAEVDEAVQEERVTKEHLQELVDQIKQQAALPGMVTVATAISGRGVDIELTELAAQKGLLVVALCLHTSQRVEMQLRGRSGRQGLPGRTKVYTVLGADATSHERQYFDAAIKQLDASILGLGKVFSQRRATLEEGNLRNSLTRRLILCSKPPKREMCRQSRRTQKRAI